MLFEALDVGLRGSEWGKQTGARDGGGQRSAGRSKVFVWVFVFPFFFFLYFLLLGYPYVNADPSSHTEK